VSGRAILAWAVVAALLIVYVATLPGVTLFDGPAVPSVIPTTYEPPGPAGGER
jgi:hypothetical protein